MRFFAAILLVLISASAVEAKPRKVRVAAVTCTDRGCSDWAAPTRTVSRGRVARVAVAAARTRHQAPRVASFGYSALVNEARRHIGATARDLGLRRYTLWCATFMDQVVLPNSGYRSLGSDRARDYARYGVRVRNPQVGAIAILTRGRRGGHIGVVSGVDGSGNPIIISGNHGRRVGEGVYDRRRVIAYVVPS